MPLDIVIINVPGTLSKQPHAAPAVLKASLIQSGFTCKTIDFNIRFHNEYENHTDYKQIESYFLTESDPHAEVEEIIDRYTDEILTINPTWVGISVFTYQSRCATELFCKALKSKSNIKIVLGGQGLSQGGINGINEYPRRLQSAGVIDYFIKSEGEISLVELLKGNVTYSGINSDTFAQINNIDNLPSPDYRDYNLTEYDEAELIVIGSRGCVRRCTFCDIHQHWEYRYRNGKLLANELISMSKLYKITKFNFADSLINGSLKQWKLFLKELATYNQQTNEKITWSGQYIVRPANIENDAYWALMSQAGAYQLYLGIETGSDKLRIEMQKKFTNKDLDYLISRLVKYNIICEFLLFVGYPTETIDDFNATLNMIKQYKHLAGTTVRNISISDTLSILPGTPLYNNATELNIELDVNENNWFCYDNPELTITERIRRTDEIRKLAIDCGYIASYNDLHNLIDYLRKNVSRFESRMTALKMLKKKTITIQQQK
jgi:radical SAM superfamily enzyme YgiQ (UPF0313 family)